jgi:hypothetical protein
VFFVVQYPLCDTRYFLPNRGNRLSRPDWPPSLKKPLQFVRSFGGAEKRQFGPEPDWADEKTYCRAHRAVRFPGLRKIRLGTADAPCKVDVVFRRLFHDGQAVARVEIGFRGYSSSETPLDTLGLLSLAQGILQLPSHVPLKLPPFRDVSLVLQGPTLARLLARATRKASSTPTSSEPDGPPTVVARSVEDGNPILIVELSPEEWTEPPDAFQRINPEQLGGARLAFGWVEALPDSVVGMWVLSPGNADAETIRALRLCLLRLHAEQEVLATVIAQIRRGWIIDDLDDERAEALFDYLNRGTRLINKTYRNGISQNALLSAFYAADAITPPADRTLLIQRLKDAHDLVWRKVQTFNQLRENIRQVSIYCIQGDQVVTNQGDIIGSTLINSPVTNVIAKQIENSFNTASGKLEGQDEKKKALAELHDTVQKLNETLAKSAPAGTDVKAKQAEVGANFEVLSQQAAADKPLPGVMEVTGKGLIDAAKTVAEMVGPITIAVKGVLALFGISLP